MLHISKLYFSKVLTNLTYLEQSQPKPLVLELDATQFNVNSKKYNVIKNLVLAASLLVAAPVTYAAATSNRVDTPAKPLEVAATVTNTNGEDFLVATDPQAKKNLNVNYDQGTPVVDINDPNAAGVSDNRFSSFSTNTGVVFKNNMIEINSALLKKKLAANPNLKHQAKTILAQVTGNNPSVIKGTLEVLGGKADLLVINPNGIDLNGVNMVNVNDFTATTAEVSANNFQQLNVKRGKVTVSADLNTDDVNMLKLIAQAVQVKAKIAPSKKKGKKADILVSAGKQSFDIASNTATALQGDQGDSKTPEVAISGSVLGSMYGNQVNFIVTEAGAGVDFDGMIVGDDNINLTTDGTIKVNQVMGNKDVAMTSKSANVEVGTATVDATAKVSKTTGNYVAGAKVTLQGKNVKVAPKTQVAAAEVALDAQENLDFSGTVNADKASFSGKNVNLADQASVTAHDEFALDLKDTSFSSASQLTALNDLFDKVTATDKSVALNSVTIATGEKYTAKAINHFIVRDDFTNYGILNLSQKDPANFNVAESNGHEVVIATGKTFANYGLLLADKLKVNSVADIKLDGATFILNDAQLVAPQITQTGDVEVHKNLSIFADSYQVLGQLEGNVTVKAGNLNTASHYADHALRRDLYEITTEVGNVDLSQIKVVGGDLKVTGNLSVKGLDLLPAQQQVAGYEVTSDASNTKARVEAVNADISVGHDFTLDGSLVNRVDALEVKVVDLLKAKSSKITLKFQPRTWINTGLMISKVQTFDSLYDLFQGLLNKQGNFSWYNGGYRMWGEYVLDTFREGVTDTYTQKVFSTVFGADWKKASYHTLQQRWNTFLSKQDQVTVALYAPGATIVAGNDFTQTNGDLTLGTDESFLNKVNDTYQANNFSVTVEKATLNNKKIAHATNDKSYQALLEASGNSELANTAQAVAATFSTSDLKNVADFAPLAAGQVLSGSKELLAATVLEQVKAQTGNYLLSQTTPTAFVNELLASTAKYQEEKGVADKYLADKLQIASANGRKVYQAQYEAMLDRLDKKVDYIVFVDNGDGTVSPRVHLSAKTLATIANVQNSAATVTAANSLSVSQAQNVASNYGVLATDSLKLEADNVSLNSDGVSTVAVANYTDIDADNFSLKGNAQLGNLDLRAGNARFSSVSTLNDQGDLVQSGTLDTVTANVEADQLSLTGFQFLANDSAAIKAQVLDLHASTAVNSIYEKTYLGDATGTVETKTAYYKAVGSNVAAGQDLTVATTGDLNLESSSLNAGKQAKVTVGGNFTSTAVAEHKTSESHQESIAVNGDAAIGLGGFSAEAHSSLVTNEGKPATDKSAGENPDGPVGPELGLGFSYTKADTTSQATTHANSGLNAQDVRLHVINQAEIGNLDLNTQVDTADNTVVPSTTITAHRVTSAQAQDTQTATSHTSNFNMGITAKAGSELLNALSTTVSSATTAARETSIDPTVALSVVSDIEDIIIKPTVDVGVEASIGGSWENSQTTTTTDSRNSYVGNLDVTTKADLNLKAVNGADLNNVSLEGETVHIKGGQSTETHSANAGSAGLSASTHLLVDLTGPKGTLDGTAQLEANWTNGAATRHQNSNIDAKNFNVKAFDAEMHSTTVTAETANVDTTLLQVTSEQDTAKSITGGFNVAGKGGAAVSPTGLANPFGSVDVGFKVHKTTEQATADQSGITANTLAVSAEKLELTGASLEARTKSEMNIDNIKATVLKDTKISDGGQASIGLSFSPSGVSDYHTAAGRDAQQRYEANVNPSIVGAKVVADVDGELNKDSSKQVEVITDKTVDKSKFTFAFSKDIAEKIKETAKTVVGKGKTIKEIFDKKDQATTTKASESESETTTATETTTTTETTDEK